MKYNYEHLQKAITGKNDDEVTQIKKSTFTVFCMYNADSVAWVDGRVDGKARLCGSIRTDLIHLLETEFKDLYERPLGFQVANDVAMNYY